MDDFVDENGEFEGEEVDFDRFAVQPKRVRGPGAEKLVIVHEDDAIIVVDKPAGMDSVPGHYGGDSAIERLECQREELAGLLGAANALDFGASGAMVLGKGKQVCRTLRGAWKAGKVRKVYMALVCGVSESSSGTVEIPLSTTGKKGMPVSVGGKGLRRAITEYRVVEQYREYALLEVVPQTGRLHQIRVHMSAIGLPLFGDSHYGRKQTLYLSEFKRGYRRSNRGTERPLIARLALHASSVEFDHPTTGERMSFECELPKDMKRTATQLDKFGR